MPLLWLRDGIASTSAELGAEFHHDSGALTRVLDQLAERGLLERIRCDGEHDRRKVQLLLTPAGRENVESLIPAVVETLNLALEDFTGAEVRDLVRLLLKLNASLVTISDQRSLSPSSGIK